jgi:geranylgeranyl reductase family protein
MIRIRAVRDTDADIAIAGAGPAGAAAAFHFARAGYRVLLLDQRRFPRDKVCGDFLGPAALVEIEHMGLLSHPVFREGNQIRRAALYLDGARLIAQVVPHLPGKSDHGMCIPRLLLDDVLLRGALASGVRFVEGARVTGYRAESGCIEVTCLEQGRERKFKARLLVGADGSSSLISRILRGAPPPRRDRILAVRGYFEEIEGPQDQADLYFSSSTFPGYCWVFPTGGRSANVGVGTLLETFPPTREIQLNHVLTDLIGSDPAISFRLSTAHMKGKIVGWPLATFNPALPIVHDRVILIGDAAGLINPLNGEGIQYALQSARWAAETLDPVLRRDHLSAHDLSTYDARIHDELRLDMALCRLIIDLISNRTLNPLWLQALRTITRRATADKKYAQSAGAILAGIAPARDALGWRVLCGTIEQAVLGTAYDLAVDALHGPGHLFQTAVDTARKTATMSIESALRPSTSLKWGVQCLFSAVELAAQFGISVLGSRAANSANKKHGEFVR